MGKVSSKTCNIEGCTNKVQKGGVCVRHGAEIKKCSSEGCTNQVQKDEDTSRYLYSSSLFKLDHNILNQIVRTFVELEPLQR